MKCLLSRLGFEHRSLNQFPTVIAVTPGTLTIILNVKPSLFRQKKVIVGTVVGWLVGLFYGVSTVSGPFIADLSHFDKSFKQFSLVYIYIYIYIYI